MAGIPRPRPLLFVATAMLWLAAQTTAQANGIVPTLTDIAKARLDVLSFLTLACVLLAWAVKGLWNHLAKRCPDLPKISYGRSVKLLLLAGSLMYVIVTLTLWARPLLEPGIWLKKGNGYELKTAQGQFDPERKASIEWLLTELRRYAKAHEGKLPDSRFSGEIPQEAWRVPSGIGTYNYLPSRAFSDEPLLLAWEPVQATDHGFRYVLLASGAVEQWDDDEIWEALKEE